jgi:hypothetical protein
MKISIRARLLATTLVLMGAASPALAQEMAAQAAGAQDQAAPAPAMQDGEADQGPDIVVTGSMLRQHRYRRRRRPSPS